MMIRRRECVNGRSASPPRPGPRTTRLATAGPGMYPTIASRIVEHVRYEGRFKSVKELYESEDIIQGNDRVIQLIKNNEARFTVG